MRFVCRVGKGMSNYSRDKMLTRHRLGLAGVK